MMKNATIVCNCLECRKNIYSVYNRILAAAAMLKCQMHVMVRDLRVLIPEDRLSLHSLQNMYFLWIKRFTASEF